MSKVVVLSAALLCASTNIGRAQRYQSHLSCGLGQLRGDQGQCAPIEQVLAAAGTVYWVDQNHALASDANPGTKTLPWKTISRATGPNVLRPGDGVIVREGTYREAIRPQEGGAGPSQRMTFAAYTGETVVVTGADGANDEWTRYQGTIYRRPYTQTLDASCPWEDCSSVIWRRELLVVDGEVMRHVDAINTLVPGTFHVDGRPPETAPRWIYARFPHDAAPSNYAVEVGQRPLLFAPYDDAENCNTSALGHYRVIGFTFRHAVNRPQKGALCAGRKGSLIEDNIVEWVNGLGIKCTNRGHIFRGNSSRDNGQAGIGGGCDASLIEHNASLRNNWKGFPWGFEAGGGKWARADSTVIRYHLAQDNEGPGLWFDIYNHDNVIEGCRILGNYAAGILLEHHTVRTVVRNNVVYGTRWNEEDSPPWTGSGILSQAANGNTLIFNTLVANEGSGIYIRKDPGNRADDIGGDGYNDIYNNLFVENGRRVGEAVYEIEVWGKTTGAVRTNKLDGNVYWDHAATPGGPTFRVSTTAPGHRSTTTTSDITRWRTEVQGDAQAALVHESGLLINDADSEEGWRLIGGSAAIGAAVVMPDSVAMPAFDIEGKPRPATGSDVGAYQYGGATSGLPAVHELPLQGAWQIVSSHITPDEPALETLFGDLIGNVVVVKNGRGEVFMPEYGINSIGSWRADEAYMVYMSTPGVLTLTGWVVTPELTPLTLSEGWTLIPYYLQHPTDPATALATVDDALVLAKDQFGNVYYPEFGINTIGAMVPGQGYKIYLSQDATLLYPADGAGASKAGHALRGFSSAATGSNATLLVFAPATLEGHEVYVDTERDTIVGRGMVQGGKAVITLYGDDGMTEGVIEGAVAGEPLFLKARPDAAHTGVVASVASVTDLITGGPLSGALQYQPDAVWGVAVADVPVSFSLAQNYPNPFNPSTTIQYTLPAPAHIKLMVYNLLGQEVAVLVDEPQASGVYEVIFAPQGFPSGHYIYRLEAGTYRKTKHMMLVK